MVGGLDFKVWEFTCCCFMFSLGLVSNAIVCVVVIKKGPKFRAAPFNQFLMGLALVDLLVSVLSVPFYLTLVAEIPHPSGVIGSAVCKISHGLPFWLAGCSIYLLVCISFERYKALKEPLISYARNKKRRNAIYFVASTGASLIPQLPTLIGIEYVESNASVGQCRYAWSSKSRRVIYPIGFVIQFVIPGTVFIVNFLRIRKCLKHLDETLYRNISDERVRQALMRRKKRTVRIVFLVTAAFFICWTPDHVMYLMYQYYGQSELAWNSDLYQAALVLGFFSSCINPLLYAFQSKDFRDHCKSVFATMCQRRVPYQAIRGSKI